jgi:tape measure domain-containing protein
MSTTVDQRVVEMRFDNKQFENNIQTSLSSIAKLKKSLNMDGATKGLESVEKASGKINLSGLSNAVETVNAKFSALEVMAITALANITNSAVNAGRSIVSALTIDPIKTGFQEYETQINAVQTILANTSSKGTTLDQVNNALDELNHYADMTIYNFTEMTRNIGTFTAAGVDLDTSVSAIKGIANLAAVSGSTSQQASTVMYQLSQALAAGTVKLQDWNSVVNAGMGGQVFQDALKETARVHGIAIDDMIKDEGSFRETLQKGWLTSDILTETLSKFTGDLNEEQLRTMGYSEEQIASIIKMGQTANDAATKVKTFTQLFDTLKEAAQSGWTQSWEIIVGDFEEAKELLTEMSDIFSAIINSSADARNSMLQGWKDLGGRTALIEAARNAFEGVLSIIKPVKEAFREIFPPMTAQQLYNITDALRNLTAHLKLSDTNSENLKRTFKGLFAVIDIVKQAFVAVAKGVGSLLGGTGDLASSILSVTARLRHCKR